MNIWFMYDNHAFKRIGCPLTELRIDLEARIEICFGEDGCGSVFFKEENKSTDVRLSGHKLPEGPWGVTQEEIKKFLDDVDERINWLARG